MSEKVFNVLFLCTANSARSVMAEGWLNTLGQGRFHAYSAGSQPSGRVNPHAIALLDSIGYDTRSLRSKSWDEFEGEAAPRMDIVITVCGNARGESCPVWPGHPLTAHWEFEDPHGDSEAALVAAFGKVFTQIKHRVELLVNLPDDKLEHLSLSSALQEIGDTQPH
ncbi:arsenate reductase ArsC [Neisseriaceae bacterium JH1-16]|nr:arsenate reductase ArsC [Neisseriaceae bacterium JH1-16]